MGDLEETITTKMPKILEWHKKLTFNSGRGHMCKSYKNPNFIFLEIENEKNEIVQNTATPLQQSKNFVNKQQKPLSLKT